MRGEAAVMDPLVRAVLPSVRHIVGDAEVTLCLTRRTADRAEIHPSTIKVGALLDALLGSDEDRLGIEIAGPDGVTYSLTLTMDEES